MAVALESCKSTLRLSRVVGVGGWVGGGGQGGHVVSRSPVF